MYFKIDSALPPFIPVPRFMLGDEYTTNAKLTYGLLLSRATLSQKTNWASEEGNVYVIYTIKQLSVDLNKCQRPVKKF